MKGVCALMNTSGCIFNILKIFLFGPSRPIFPKNFGTFFMFSESMARNKENRVERFSSGKIAIYKSTRKISMASKRFCIL